MFTFVLFESTLEKITIHEFLCSIFNLKVRAIPEADVLSNSKEYIDGKTNEYNN